MRVNSVFASFRFILRSKEEINNHLTDAQKTADEKVKELEVESQSQPAGWRPAADCVFVSQQKKVYLERSVREAEDNIREMLMARRAQ